MGDAADYWKKDDPPPGMLPDGKLNVVPADAPPFEPKIIDEFEEDLDDVSDLDDEE